MTEAERKRLLKVNPISIALNITLVLLGILISLGSILMIYQDKDLTGVVVHIINHMLIYVLVLFNTCYGYRLKKVYFIRIIAIIFAALTITSAIIFLANSDLAVPMSIFAILASLSLIYFSIRIDKTIEAHIALAIALLFFLIYSITGCVRLDVGSAEKEVRFFYGLSLFGSFIVTCSIFHSYFVTQKPRFNIMNPPKESEIEHIIQ